MFRRILLAVDGSEGSKKAVEVATNLATTTVAEVLVFHVREVEMARGGDPVETPQEAADLVNGIAEDLKAKGVTAVADARTAPYGSAAREIVSEAEAAGVDLIVMSARELSDVTALLIGSVAHKVLHLAHCPVLIAR